MANTIKPKRSYTASATPTLAAGEIGINATDGKIWIGNAAGNANVLIASLAFSDHTGTLAVTAGGTGVTTSTGSGSVVLSTSPTLTTPTLGAATATTVNKVTITAPATGATVTIANGKTLTVSNTLTFTGTDSSSVAFGAGGTVLYSGGALGTPSSGTLTNCTFPTLNQNTTGSSGSCTGNSATATKSTNISGGNNTTLLGSIPYQSNTDTTTLLSPNTTTTKKYFSQTGTGTNGAAPSWSQVAVSELSGFGANVATWLATPSSANLAAALTDETGTGANVFGTSPTLTTPTITGLKETKTAPSISSGTLSLDCASGNVFAVSLNANITTLSFTNVPASGTAYGLTLALTADGTARTITWGAAVKWPGGTAPTVTSTNAKVDVFVLTTWDGGTTWYAFVSGQNL